MYPEITDGYTLVEDDNYVITKDDKYYLKRWVGKYEFYEVKWRFKEIVGMTIKEANKQYPDYQNIYIITKGGWKPRFASDKPYPFGY